MNIFSQTRVKKFKPIAAQVDHDLLLNERLGQLYLAGSQPLFLIAMIAWLMTHAYTGVRHDGMLYVGQALRRLFPKELANDVFFRFGSQDDYTWFSNLYAWCIAHWGLSAAHMILVIAAQVLFCLAVWFFLKRLFGAIEGGLAAIFVAAFPAIYGGGFCLGYGESFLTARNFAEPACVLALYLLVNNQRWLSLALIGFAATIHPLIALPVLAVWWLYAAFSQPKFAWSALLLVPPLLAVALGKLPLVSRVYDADWWLWFQWANAWLVLPSHWSYVDWSIIISDVLALYLLWFSENDRQLRRLYAAIWLMAVAGIALSMLLAEGLHNVLFTGLQLWRGHWLLHLVAVAALPVLLLRAWRGQDIISRATTPLFIIACLTPDLPAQSAALAIALLFMVFAKEKSISESSVKLIRRSLWLILPLSVLKYFIAGGNALIFSQVDLSKLSMYNFLVAASLQPVALYFSLLMVYAITRISHRLILSTAMSLLILLFCSAWDRRSPWQIELENSVSLEHPYARYIPSGASVYWEEGQRENVWTTWLMLHRESYYSSQQASAILFNRDSAQWLWQRRALLKPVWMQYQACDQYKQITGLSDCKLSDDVLDEVCQSADAPGFVVLKSHIDRPLLASWRFPVSRDGGAMTYLYSCADIKRHLSKEVVSIKK